MRRERKGKHGTGGKEKEREETKKKERDDSEKIGEDMGVGTGGAEGAAAPPTFGTGAVSYTHLTLPTNREV